MKKFLLEKGPFVRSVDEGKISTNRMMYDVVIALIPIALFGFILTGLIPFINNVDGMTAYYMLKPLINVLVGILASIVFEGLYFVLFKKVRGFKNIWNATVDSFAMVPGFIIALILPAYTPVYVILFACFMANIIFKMLFGGLGHNVFNPALIGYAFAVAAFGSVISEASKVQAEILYKALDLSVVAGATPLDNLASLVGANHTFALSYDAVCGIYGGLLKMFIGLKAGALGEVSGLLCVVAYIYLVARKVINYKTPLIYVGTVFILTWLVGIINGVEGACLGIWFPTFNILSGGLLFGAVFMATEPVTTPKSPNGKVIYAIALGICTVLFRLVGSLPEGVATSILFMCLFTPAIDRFAAKNRGPVINSKLVVRYVLLGLFFALVIGYTLYKASPSAMKEAVTLVGGAF